MENRCGGQHYKFFRRRLSQLEPEEIQAYLNNLDAQSKKLKKQIYEICWAMRGGITADQAWELSPEDREIILEIMKQNVERTNESGLAVM